MKTLISNYVFNPSSRQITFSDYSAIALESILLVTNVSDNVIIYNFANANLGGSVTGNTLTLTYNTSAMSSNDKLQIFYDDGLYPASNETQLAFMELLENNYTNMKQLLQLLKPLGIVVSSSGRLSIDINAITSLPTLATVTTVGTVANQTNLGGLNALDAQVNLSKIAWSTSLRNNLTF